MKIRVQITSASGPAFTFEHGGPELRIGRDPDVELALSGDASQPVSWHHARIELTSRTAYVNDLRSTNGTFVNGTRVEGKTPLKLGDEVQLGSTGPIVKIIELDLAEPRRQAAAPPPVAKPPVRREPAAAVPSPVPIKPREKMVEPSGKRQQTIMIASGSVTIVLLAVTTFIFWRLNRPAADKGAEVAARSTTPTNGTALESPTKAETPPVPEKEDPALAKSNDTPTAPVVRPQAPEQATTTVSRERRELGRYATEPKDPPSILLQRQRDPDPWGRLRPNDRVRSAYYLLSPPGYRSRIYLDSGVHATLWGNVPEFSPFPPVLESTVMLSEPSSETDLDMTLDRGRVHLANFKPSGAARVRVRFYQETWDITLPDANSEAVVELWGLYPREVPFSKEPGGKGPLACLGLFAKGPVQVHAGGKDYPLSDRSRLTWTNASASLVGPEVLPALPDWWTNQISADARKQPEKADMMLAIADFAAALDKTSAVVDAVLTQVRESPDASNRVLGVFFLGALDAIPSLVDALDDRQHPDVRGTAAFTLRHWTSRNADYDLELYRTLYEKKGYAKEKAEIIMRLLHSFSDAELAKPETYQLLIGYLDHENLVIRDLAIWHLALLLPQGTQKIAYDPAGDPEKRKKAVEEWKKLLPAGTLPAGRRPEARQ
jgi:hypothetical protein